ncbi:minor tail protein [Mycobacterium phage Corofin]|nr:minor tail protein [Mycobacterium phage Corofin]
MSGWFPSRPEDVDASLRSWFPERQPRPVTSQTGWWALLTIDAKLSVEYVSTAELGVLRGMGVVASVSLTREVALQKLGMLAVARTLSMSGAAAVSKVGSMDVEAVVSLARAVALDKVLGIAVSRTEAMEAAVALDKVLGIAVGQTINAERTVGLQRVGALEVTRLYQTYADVSLLKVGMLAVAAPVTLTRTVTMLKARGDGPRGRYRSRRGGSDGLPAAHAGDPELHGGWGVHLHLSAQRDLLRPDHARRWRRRQGHGICRRVGVGRQRWQLRVRHGAAWRGLRVVGDLVHRHGRPRRSGRCRVIQQRCARCHRAGDHVAGVRRYDADRCGRRGRHHREPRERRRKVAGRPDTGRVDGDRWCSGGVRQRQRSWRRRGRCRRVDHAWRYRRAWRGGVSRIPVVTPK